MSEDELSTNAIAQGIYDTLDDYDYGDATLDNLFSDEFNADGTPYIIGTKSANDALNNYEPENDDSNLNGALGAVQLVQSYEQDELGEVDTDLGNPEQLASMVAYIRAENILNGLDAIDGKSWDEVTLDDNTIKAIKDELEEYYDIEA